MCFTIIYVRTSSLVQIKDFHSISLDIGIIPVIKDDQFEISLFKLCRLMLNSASKIVNKVILKVNVIMP